MGVAQTRLVYLCKLTQERSFRLGIGPNMSIADVSRNPFGALIFGRLADRFGRRTPYMVNIFIYSVVELLTAFSPNFVTFLVLRALYGVAMGGVWGVGAALALEALPTKTRGLFSGILQQGYAAGYLLAAVAYFL